MKHGSLFSGGGGFELAAEVMGWETVFHSEINPFCQKVLKHYWPNAESVGDIKQFDAKTFKGKIDILTGGFPCQPFSMAGKRKGTSDNRYLWPDMLRVIREIKPRWVVAENVYGIINWDGGLVFEQVQADLENEGYQVQTILLPAAGVNAPHRRYRVWFIAYSHNNGSVRGNRKNEKQSNKARKHAQHDISQICQFNTDTGRKRLSGRPIIRGTPKCQTKTLQQFSRLFKRGYWKDWPTQPPLCSEYDGIPRELDGIAFSKWRQESIKMYGNAIVPEVAIQIFKVIAAMETQFTT